MAEIALAAVGRIIKSIDPEIRVGVTPKEELRSAIEDIAGRIAELAVSMAKNANRNTVLIQDITAAREQLMKGIAFHQTTVYL